MGQEDEKKSNYRDVYLNHLHICQIGGMSELFGYAVLDEIALPKV
jgi:hypothetical protein